MMFGKSATIVTSCTWQAQRGPKPLLLAEMSRGVPSFITYNGIGCHASNPTVVALAGSTVSRQESAQASQSPLEMSPPQVVLTREVGKNNTLKAKLEARGISCLEMPLIETAKGPDRDKLPVLLREQEFDWVCVTSPESAMVLMEGWRAAGKPPIRVAVVGDGTARVFREAEETALLPQFTPTVANAEHFGPELPKLPGGSHRVLYPASNKAATTLQNGLTARGFDVLRLNTYDTLPVPSLDENVLGAARQAAVVAIASPSAVKAWLHFAGEQVGGGLALACIGSTSARAAEKAGISKDRIFYPEEPGLDTFVETIETALSRSMS